MKRFAILSDLHCHPSSEKIQRTYLFTDALRDPKDRHPVESLIQLVRSKKIKPGYDALITPGDLTNMIDRQGLTSGWAYIKEVASALKARSIISTVGNHDIDSKGKHSRLSKDPFHLAVNLGTEFPLSSATNTSEYWQHGVTLFTKGDVAYLVINSTFGYRCEKTCRRGGVTEAQLSRVAEITKSASKPYRIAICHHHPILHEDLHLGADDVMENGSLLIKILEENNFQVVIHGHKHHPKLQYGPGGNNSIPVFAAGSLSAVLTDELAQFSRNTFHEMHIFPCGKGIVETWKFRLSEGWTNANQETTGIPFRTGFGNREPIEEIATKIEQSFSDIGKELADWKEMCKRVPNLEYLVPSSFKALGLHLSQRGLTLSPEPPDWPTVIGRLQG